MCPAKPPDATTLPYYWRTTWWAASAFRPASKGCNDAVAKHPSPPLNVIHQKPPRAALFYKRSLITLGKSAAIDTTAAHPVHQTLLRVEGYAALLVHTMLLRFEYHRYLGHENRESMCQHSYRHCTTA